MLFTAGSGGIVDENGGRIDSSIGPDRCKKRSLRVVVGRITNHPPTAYNQAAVLSRARTQKEAKPGRSANRRAMGRQRDTRKSSRKLCMGSDIFDCLPLHNTFSKGSEPGRERAWERAFRRGRPRGKKGGFGGTTNNAMLLLVCSQCVHRASKNACLFCSNMDISIRTRVIVRSAYESKEGSSSSRPKTRRF
jgi:hypothetical protein